MNTRRQLQRRSDSDLRGVYLWLVLWKAARALEAHARGNVKTLGMCASDFGVLEALLHKGPLPVSALGAKVLLTSGSITTAVDRLERRGWVKRRNDANDRRARMVYLTDSGRRLIRKAFADHEQAMEQTVSALALGERRVLVNLLRKLGRSAEGLLEKRRRGAVKGGHWQQKI
jgi:MarR family 2-MHQ and catechol resistance regulon transcriptional repressor